ncbi:MAG: outer membrane beta-barrel protein [Fimbriimonas sp.]|nr:outer membrane beta-barrel protein [Fimbriimonas sp.]
MSPAPAKMFDVSGYVDLYYQNDFGKTPSGQPVNGRWYDVDHSNYRLAAIQVDLSKAPTSLHPFGFYVSLLGGANANVLASTEPGGIDTYKDFAQAYVTYMAPTKVPLTVDFGKWYAFIGYEGLDSRTQDNYSRSFTFTGLEPDYMTGIRATAAISAKWTVNGYLYQGYNEVENSNSTLKTGLGVTYSPNGKLTATLQGYNGKESSSNLNESGTYGGIGFPAPGQAWVTQINPVVVYKANSKDKYAFDGTYASASGMGNWNGQAVYYRRQFDGRNAACLRVDRADDSAGLRFLAGGIQLCSFTGTYDYKVNDNLLLRFELRHDTASHPFFNSSGGGSQHRTTLTFAQIIQF